MAWHKAGYSLVQCRAKQQDSILLRPEWSVAKMLMHAKYADAQQPG